MNRAIVTAAIVAALGIGFGAGYWLSIPQAPIKAMGDETPSSAREVLFWRNSMKPAITSPVLIKDEMGMDYIPVYADGDDRTDGLAGTVSIDPVTVQSIGVRTTKVEQRTLTRQLNALGRVDFNEESLARLHPKTSGWIEGLSVNETGTQVNHDTILLSIYSPDLVMAQQEYLVALANWESLRNKSATSVLNSARERLELFDVPAHQIKVLEQSRKINRHLHIHSPFQGRVMSIGARVGQYVSPGDELYMIADLSRIWVNVDVFEDELAWLKVGDRAEMRVRAVPGRTYQGEVTFIHPVLNSKSRTVQVRLELDNTDLSLKPGMFANVVLYTDPQPEALVVPSESILRTGSRDQVFVMREAGKFEPRNVTLGMSADGVIQILDGVKAGEQVVTSGQFLIDSESKLREATAKMMAAIQGSSSVAGGRMPGATIMDPGESADADRSAMSMGDAHKNAGITEDTTVGRRKAEQHTEQLPGAPGATDMDMSGMEMKD